MAEKKPINCHKVADFLSLFSNPLRLKILCLLTTKERTVSELVDLLGCSKYNLSHQLKILGLKEIINKRRDGKFIYCSIKNGELIQILETLSNHIEKLN